MNGLDRQFDRLLRSAAAAPKATVPAGLPFAVEARVLAAWRGSRAEGGDLAALLRFFRYGLAAACALALVAVSLSWRDVQQETTDEFAIVDAELNVAMLR